MINTRIILKPIKTQTQITHNKKGQPLQIALFRKLVAA